MKVRHGRGRTEYGPGVQIDLTPAEVSRAVDAYLVARGVVVSGPRTLTLNEEAGAAGIYVDPSGFVIRKGRKIDGRGAGASE